MWSSACGSNNMRNASTSAIKPELGTVRFTPNAFIYFFTLLFLWQNLYMLSNFSFDVGEELF